jgi:type 1 fimbria pilin
MLATIVMIIIVFILFIFFVIMFIVYFDYILSIASLSLCLCISSYSARSKVHGVGGQHCVNVVLIHCLPVDTLYIPGHVVDHGCDTSIESFVVHSPNIDIEVGSHLRRRSKLCS